MKALIYPKISDSRNFPCKDITAFEKIDGTNIHFVWKSYGDKQNGLATIDDFGTRRDHFPINNGGLNKFKKAHPGLEDVADWKLLENFLFPLEVYLYDHYMGITDSIIIFTEFAGPNSFAGQHKSTDKKELTIIDVMIGKAFLSPKEFINQFGQFKIPKIIYQGKYSGQFVKDIEDGKYSVNEGVVCKGFYKGQVHMCKIKTNNYMDRLKQSFGDEWEKYW